MEDYRPGRLATVLWDSSTGMRQDRFVRGPGDSLVHWWNIDFGSRGVEDLGGKLRGDPVAMSRRPDRLDIFARGWGSVLLHWWWDGGQIRGPESPRPRWRLAYDPTAACPDAARADVYTQGVDNFLRIIGTIEDGWFIDNTPIEAAGPVCAVPFAGDVDIFSRGRDGKMAATGEFHIGEGRSTQRPGGALSGRPVAQRWSHSRVDVFALDEQGSVNHWGWSGKETFGPHRGVWYTDEGILKGRFQGELIVLGDADQMDLLAVTVDGVLQKWQWDGAHGFMPYNEWRQDKEFAAGLGPVTSPISTITTPGGQTFGVYAWGNNGVLHAWRNGQLSSSTPDWPQTNPLPEPVHIDLRPASHLVRRPDDMVILGVDLDGFVSTGPIEVTGEGHLGLTFPPQHIGEEVNNGAGPLNPSIHEAGVQVWQSCLSGPSRLVFAAGPEVALTAAQLLAAAADTVVTDDAQNRSAVELPSRLFSHLVGAARATHQAEPWVSDDVVALWRTRIVGVDLGLSAVGYGEEEDSFELPLGFSARGLIAAQATPAAVERLELSALGGWLTAHGRWPSFEWDHEALLGRDWKVRTLVRGIIYPTGHRAEYVEFTSRDADVPGQDPIAVLRKRRFLTITEPVRGRPADERLARVFPFDSVEVTDPVVNDVEDPQWTSYHRPSRAPEGLLAELAAAREELQNLPPMPGDAVGSPPIVEDLADGGGDDLAAQQAALANRILDLLERIDALADHIEAVLLAQAKDVPWFFVPRRSATSVRIPMRCNGPQGPVSFDLPIVFVADLDLPQTPTMTAFDSLTDGGIATLLANAFAGAGGGVIPLAAARIDLLRSAGHQEIDLQVVRQLNIVGVRDGRGFRPRLGPPQQPDDPGATPQYAETWAVEVELVEMRNLLPDKTAAHTAMLSFAKSFEDGGDASPIPLTVNGNPLPVDFRGATERCGGLISPVIEATGLSRQAGLVNAAGLENLDPRQMVGPDATLLGVPLHAILDGVTTPPTITSDLSPGGVTTVTMAWTAITLTPSGPLQKKDEATNPVLDLNVVTGQTTTTTCTVKNFALALPPKTALLKLLFDEVTFTQEAGHPPRVAISGLKAEFFGELDLLQALQDKIGLGDSMPEIRVTGNEIVVRYSLPVPDVATGAFVIRDAMFGIALTVPFRGDPVSVTVGFASREKPFQLSVMMYGGGGYAAIEFRGGDLHRLEISLEFGAAVAVEFLIAKGEAHVLGGIRFELTDGEVSLTGFLRIGGSLEILGLVSVSIELLLELGYQTKGNRLVGRATLVIELDLTLWSDTVELDSGEWVISGEETAHAQMVGAAAATRPRANTDQIEAARAFRRAYR